MQKPELDPTAIRREFDQFARDLAKAEPAPTTRTWSFELETPSADSIRARLQNGYRNQDAEIREIMERDPSQPEGDPTDILAFCGDGSVVSQESQDCECDCASCTYHECDCEHCDNRNEYPEHDCGYSECDGSGTYQEIKPATYCEGTHPAHLALLDYAQIDTAEINDTCGLHVHIGSDDLSVRDVANTIRVYRALAHIIEPIAGRRDENYCQDNTDSEARRAQFERQATEKYRAVNTAPHFAEYRPNTIEFRQHEGTNDTAEIRAWAMLMIRIVEFAKTNRTTLWLEEATTFAEAWKLLTAKR